jgi:hypothetical protein
MWFLVELFGWCVTRLSRKSILMVCFHFLGELDAGVYGVQVSKKDENYV